MIDIRKLQYKVLMAKSLTDVIGDLPEEQLPKYFTDGNFDMTIFQLQVLMSTNLNMLLDLLAIPCCDSSEVIKAMKVRAIKRSQDPQPVEETSDLQKELYTFFKTIESLKKHKSKNTKKPKPNATCQAQEVKSLLTKEIFNLSNNVNKLLTLTTQNTQHQHVNRTQRVKPRNTCRLVNYEPRSNCVNVTETQQFH